MATAPSRLSGTFGVAVSPRSVAVADYNNDGKNDVVAACSFFSEASLLLGNGNGTFQADKVFDPGSSPWSVAAADFNGDGKSDMATADRGGDTVSVFLGNGNSTFQATRYLGTGDQPNTIAVADFNGDAVQDLVTANEGDGTLSVLLGNGTTTTTTTTTTTYGLQPIAGVSLATQADALTAQGQIDGYLDTVNRVSATIGTASAAFRSQPTSHHPLLTSRLPPKRASPMRIWPRTRRCSCAVKSSSKRPPRCSHRRTNNPRWLLLCYASR